MVGKDKGMKFEFTLLLVVSIAAMVAGLKGCWG